MTERNPCIPTPSVEDLNNLPLNLKAREMLRQLTIPLDTTRLHAVRLALWAIDSGLFEANEALDQTVRAMETWLPQRIVNFLMPDGSLEYGPQGWKEAREPAALACAILTDLEERVATFFPWYLNTDF